jgi:N4-gp56 family major capsid protein
MPSTTLNDVINPEVMADIIEAKTEAKCKLIPYAHVNTDLQGTAGDTITVPAWNYIGDAEDFDVEQADAEDKEAGRTNLTASAVTFTIKCAMKVVSILQTAINSGLGNPVGQATLQLSKSIINKIDNDILDAIYDKTKDEKVPCIVADETTATINYDGIVDAVTKFEDEEDFIDKVMFIHPKQEKALLTDDDFLSADKFQSGVAVEGAVGKIAGCWIKKSKKVKQDETGAWLNPILKLEPDDPETEYTEDEFPAVTIFLKKETQVDHEWLPKRQRHDLTASKYYGVAVTNAAKLVVAKFKGTLTA